MEGFGWNLFVSTPKGNGRIGIWYILKYCFQTLEAQSEGWTYTEWWPKTRDKLDSGNTEKWGPNRNFCWGYNFTSMGWLGL